MARPNKNYTLSRKDRTSVIVHWQVREMIRYHSFLNNMSLAAATYDIIRAGFKARGYFTRIVMKRIVGQCNAVDFADIEHLAAALEEPEMLDTSTLTNRQKLTFHLLLVS